MRVFVFFLILFMYSSAYATELQDLKKRIETLEQKQIQTEIKESDGSNKVSSFLGEKISLGGFFEHAVTANFSKDKTFEVAPNSHILALNLSADLHPKFSFVNQTLFFLIIPHNNEHDVTLRSYGAAAALSLTAHAYGEYRPSDYFHLQMGLGWVPFGIAAANRELPLFLRRNGPQISSAGLGFPLGVWTGLHAYGNFNTPSGDWGYHVYSTASGTSTNRMGGGSRLFWHSNEKFLSLGFSNQVFMNGTDSAFSLGGDLEIKKSPVGLRAEYARSFVSGSDSWTAYGEPYVELGKGKWIIHGEVDYANRPMISTDPATFTPFERLDLGGGVNFLPWPFLKARLLFLFHNYLGASNTSGGKTNDYYTVEYSTAIEF